MQIRHKYETDGRCVSKLRDGCVVLGDECRKECGTYGCPFYKPKGCQDWVRIEADNGLIRLFAPEEVTYGD